MSRQETWREIMDVKNAVINRLRDQRERFREQIVALDDQVNELLAALERLDTVTTWGDSHSKHYTFNEDDAVTIRAAIAKAKATGGEK